jgi:hypothetical protein
MTDDKIETWLSAEFAESEAHSHLWATISRQVRDEFPHLSLQAINAIIAARIERIAPLHMRIL